MKHTLKIKPKIVAAVTALCMVFTCGVASSDFASAAAGADKMAQENGSDFTPVSGEEQTVLVIFGEAVTKGDGLQHSWKALTQKQLSEITDESSAAGFFGTAGGSFWLTDETYTLRQSNGLTTVKKSSGLNLKAVGESLGVPLLSNARIQLSVASAGGSREKIKNIFSVERHAFIDPRNPVTNIAPMLELKQGGLPSLRIGQETAEQVNTGAWAEDINELQLDAVTSATQVPSVVFTATIDSRDYNYTMGDIIHAGQYRAIYRYTSGGKQTTANVTGIPLEKLLASKGIKLKDGDFIRTKAKTAENGTAYTTVSYSDMKRCFVAYDGTETAGAAADPLSSRTEFCFYGPAFKLADYWGVDVSTKPAAPSGFRAVSKGLRSVRLSWKKEAGADGYELYNTTTKKKVIFKKSATTGYTAKRLKTGKTYGYKLRAYKNTASGRLYGSYTKIKKAKPAPAIAKMKKAARSSARSLTLKWGRVAGADGYQAACSTSGKFKKSKTKKVYVKKGKTVKTTIRNLKKGKKYYLKVRAYKTVKGKKIYGPYSAVKKKRL